jgi:hypothetical protein
MREVWDDWWECQISLAAHLNPLRVESHAGDIEKNSVPFQSKGFSDEMQSFMICLNLIRHQVYTGLNPCNFSSSRPALPQPHRSPICNLRERHRSISPKC